MCGITGIIVFGNKTEYQIEDVLTMTKTIRHRGPDDEGYLLYDGNTARIFGGDDTKLKENLNPFITYYPEKHILNSDKYLSKVAFGYRRLSIIDLSPSGHQPMSYMDKYWIVFNGEIYNYLELKEELEFLGYKFVSESDTEVIMAAYDKWGLSCLNKFNGMWAFALLDVIEKNIFIARDRFGIKPLYYYQDNDKFVFGSEIKAILANPGIKSSPNIPYLKDYIKNGFKGWIKETAFTNVYSFKAANYAVLSLKKSGTIKIEEKQYWQLKSNLKNEKYDKEKADQYSKQYYLLLSDAVRLRMRADVKIGSALSGGLDSSSIVHLVNEHLKSQKQEYLQETFSNIYSAKETKSLDESEFINTLVKYLNVNSNKCEPQFESIIRDLESVVYFFENPPSGSAMSGWNVFKCIARTDIKVNLDGQGADEQLAGYLSYYSSYLANCSVQEAFLAFRNIHKASGINYRTLILVLIINVCKKILGKNNTEKILMILNKNIDVLKPLNKILEQDLSTNLMTLLHYGDRLSMAHSIESRVPFMDYRFVEFVASIPACYKIHNGWTKYIARNSMKEFLPESVVWRKDKMGFPNADEYWFKDKLQDWFISSIENSTFIGEINERKEIRNRIKSNEPFNNLMRLLIVSIWHDVFFKDK